MALTLTNSTLTNPADKSEIEANFSDVQNKFGNIDNSDIKSSAGIDVSKLSASKEYMTVTMEVDLAVAGATTGRGVSCSPIPNSGQGLASSKNWTIKAYSWMCSEDGGSTADVTISLGYYSDAAGTWSTTGGGAIATLTNIAAGSGESVSPTTTSIVMTGSQTLSFRTFVDNADGTAGTLWVSILLERDIQ